MTRNIFIGQTFIRKRNLGEETKSDMWTNTFFSGVSSVIEGDNSAYTPFLTTSYTVNDYLEMI